MIRVYPDTDDTVALDKLHSATVNLRMLVYQLAELGLPIEPFWRTEGGLAFDLTSSITTGKPVVIGHANGVVTIDLAETMDAYRERLRVRLGEPYRTMLGHFRHEVGHYYQNVLIENGEGAARYLDECREIFGDERASYQDAINRHYKFGAPENWHESFISEYATMHPWEDFAECFAHYLHITGTIDTARESGLMLDKDLVRFSMDRAIVPLESYADEPIERLLYDWKWLSAMFNRVNAAMGGQLLYPFDIPEPVVAKLGFVHKGDPGTAKFDLCSHTKGPTTPMSTTETLTELWVQRTGTRRYTGHSSRGAQVLIGSGTSRVFTPGTAEDRARRVHRYVVGQAAFASARRRL